MKLSIYLAGLGLLLFVAAPARAQTVPAQNVPAEPPVKAVPQTERKPKPERVDEDAPESPGEAPSARGSRPERSARGARGSQGRAAGAGRGARGAGAGGAGRPAGVGRGH